MKGLRPMRLFPSPPPSAPPQRRRAPWQGGAEAEQQGRLRAENPCSIQSPLISWQEFSDATVHMERRGPCSAQGKNWGKRRGTLQCWSCKHHSASICPPCTWCPGCCRLPADLGNPCCCHTLADSGLGQRHFREERERRWGRDRPC